MTEFVKRLADYPLPDLKAVYLALHATLASDATLMDSDLLQDLQGLLQTRAGEARIDVTNHAAWNRWLQGPGATTGTMGPRRR